MKTEELIQQLQLKGFTGAQVAGIDKDGRTYSIDEVVVEHHEDSFPGAVTVWLKVDEN